MALLAVYAIYARRAGIFDEFPYRLGRNSDRVLANRPARGTSRRHADADMPAKGGEDEGGEDGEPKPEPKPNSGVDEEAATSSTPADAADESASTSNGDAAKAKRPESTKRRKLRERIEQENEERLAALEAANSSDDDAAVDDSSEHSGPAAKKLWSSSRDGSRDGEARPFRRDPRFAFADDGLDHNGRAPGKVAAPGRKSNREPSIKVKVEPIDCPKDGGSMDKLISLLEGFRTEVAELRSASAKRIDDGKRKIYELAEMLTFDAVSRNVPFELDRTFKSRKAVADTCRKFGSPVAKTLPDLRQHATL